jgi:hypothetical protein
MRHDAKIRMQLPGWTTVWRSVPWMLVTAVGLSTGCAFDHHKAVEVISEPPGARIEVNGDFVGCAPTTIELLGESDGKVEMDYAIRAYPPGPEYYPQVKLFMKRVSGDSDRIPKRVYFDMRVRQPVDQPTAAPTRQRAWP